MTAVLTATGTHRARLGFWALAACVVVLSLLPGHALPPVAFSLWDKAQHALAFTALATVGLHAYPRYAPQVLVGLLVLGTLLAMATRRLFA